MRVRSNVNRSKVAELKELVKQIDFLAQDIIVDDGNVSICFGNAVYSGFSEPGVKPLSVHITRNETL